MEQLGKLVEWHDDRGYGFIQPLEMDSRRVFLHINDYRRMGRRPELGEILRFTPERQPDGRFRATRVARAISLGHRQMRNDAEQLRHRASITTWLPPILLAGFLLLLGWASLRQHLPDFYWTCMAALNALTLLAYRRDKRASEAHRWRTPESTLHLLELLGGWPAAWLAQLWLRHKSRKPSYRVIFLIIILIHTTLTAWWLAGFPLPA